MGDENLTWLVERPIAHRGLFNSQKPENSVPAFINAIENNYGIELDIQFTKDNKIVVFHDDNLRRMTGDHRDIKDVTYEEIKTLTLLDTNERIPLLQEVLDVVHGRVPILVEIKNSEKIKNLSEETYKIMKKYNGKYAIQSFNPVALEWYKNNAKEVVRGQLSGTFVDVKLNKCKKFILKNLLLNFKSRPDYVAYQLQGLPNFRVSHLRKKGMIILTWTIKNKADMEKAYKYSDNIIFDSFVP